MPYNNKKLIKLGKRLNDSSNDITFRKKIKVLSGAQKFIETVTERFIPEIGYNNVSSNSSSKAEDYFQQDNSLLSKSSSSKHDLKLLEYAKANDFDLVNKLLDQKKLYNINVLDSNNKSLLYYAILHKNILAVEKLIQNNADLNLQVPEKDSILLTALSLEETDINIIKLLISKGADLFSRGFQGSTILHRAASCENSDILKYILSLKNISKLIDQANAFEATPLEYAVNTSNIRNTKNLLDQKASVTYKSLSSAVYNGSIEIIDLLIQYASAEIIDQIRLDSNLLCIGAQSLADTIVETEEVIKKLLVLGAPNNIPNENGMLPLDIYDMHYEINNNHYND